MALLNITPKNTDSLEFIYNECVGHRFYEYKPNYFLIDSSLIYRNEVDDEIAKTCNLVLRLVDTFENTMLYKSVIDLCRHLLILLRSKSCREEYGVSLTLNDAIVCDYFEVMNLVLPLCFDALGIDSDVPYDNDRFLWRDPATSELYKLYTETVKTGWFNSLMSAYNNFFQGVYRNFINNNTIYDLADEGIHFLTKNKRMILHGTVYEDVDLDDSNVNLQVYYSDPEDCKIYTKLIQDCLPNYIKFVLIKEMVQAGLDSRFYYI
jgi:hypothetical protein